ncbi:MAG: ABC transporter permease subunit, partial [Planctomycetota bacterium]
IGFAAPLSIATAVFLSESSRNRPRLSRLVGQALDVLAAVPSIVFGLFGNAFFCIALGLGYSILSGALTLCCMVLPILIRTFEQAISAVPNDHRYAAAGLGLSRVSTLVRVVLPMAAPSMGAGIVLGIGRVTAETAALIFTAGYVTRMPESVFDSGRTMSVHIYDLAMNVPGGSSRAHGTASALIILILIANLVADQLTKRAGKNVTAGKATQP